MKRLFLLILLMSYGRIMAQQPDSSKGGLLARPVTLAFELSPGKSSTTKLYLTNKMAEAKKFRLYLNDWRRDTIGGHVYKPVGTDPRSCARWIHLEKDFIEVQPGQTAEVLVQMVLPDSAAIENEMKWCMLFVETTQESTIVDSKGVTTRIAGKYRFGVHIYQTPATLKFKEVRLRNFTAMPDPHKYRIVCENTGAVMVTCSSYLELASLSDTSRFKLPLKEFPVFPEQKRYVDFVIPDSIPRGKYNLTGVVDAGSDVPLEAAQMIIELK